MEKRRGKVKKLGSASSDKSFKISGAPMLKYMLTTMVTASLSVATTLIAVDFQRERLTYSLSDPVQLGDLTHQKLRISNDGWRAATNIKIYLKGSMQSQADLQAAIEAFPPFDLAMAAPASLGGYERLRKNELAVVNLTFKGPPIDASMLSIKSDETLAIKAGLETETLLSALMKLVAGETNASKEEMVKPNCGT